MTNQYTTTTKTNVLRSTLSPRQKRLEKRSPFACRNQTPLKAHVIQKLAAFCLLKPNTKKANVLEERGQSSLDGTHFKGLSLVAKVE